MDFEGIVLLNKAKGKTSFSLVSALRKITKIQKIGHCGTLDPFASGVMVLLIGKKFTAKSNDLIAHDKEYLAEITLGKTTPSYDGETEPQTVSSKEPSLIEITEALKSFQGEIYQTPPMFSAKKINGKRLYHLARKGISIERPPTKIYLETKLISYEYPLIKLQVVCSKGTYIRSLAHDLGQKLSTGAFLSDLVRTRSGPFSIDKCLDQERLFEKDFDLIPFITKELP
jgi:tRNA pseudouridine55 synthase